MHSSMKIKYIAASSVIIPALVCICFLPIFHNHGHAISAIEMTIADQSFSIEIASTNAARSLGFMYRSEVPENTGMLFVYPRPQRQAFYMKNCLVDLDILYLLPDGTITDIITMKAPRENEPLRHYPSSKPVLYALELSAGTAEKLHLKTGQRLDIPPKVKQIRAESRGSYP